TLPIGTSIDDLQILDVLGLGAYGQVYLGQHKETHEHYAIKSLPQIGLDRRHRLFQENEIALHSRVSKHRHIIRLERVIRQPEWTHVILECGSQGDLFSAITERDLYYGNHDLIRKVFLQLLDAVSYCHDNHVYHRDLKPENVLVFDNGHTVKLADFGLATSEPVSNDYGCGSTFYFSPECQGDLASQQTHRVGYATGPNDVWSLGIILTNLASGRNPWRQASLHDETFRAYLKDPNFLLKILPISKELNQILKRILCVDPIRRISLDELKKRIRRCKHFTRTPFVEQYEAELCRPLPALTLKPIITSTTTTTPPTTPPSSQEQNSHHRQQQLPPSPPDTPRID
ncbi:kinase-like domain-containing protein, partial [Radiomyces spectabilis]|uniref:kinase-like domain-containing protein n=1 Tax=Radiomyces spectabilis TaxID=64574 RepID=UPI00221E5424